MGKVQGKPPEAGVVVGRTGGACGLCHSAGKPVVSGYVVGDCSWLWGSPSGEGDAHPDLYTQEMEELMPGNGVGQACPAAENLGGGGGTLKDKPEQKPAPSGAVDEKYPEVQRGRRSGRELIAPFLDLWVV